MGIIETMGDGPTIISKRTEKVVETEDNVFIDRYDLRWLSSIPVEQYKLRYVEELIEGLEKQLLILRRFLPEGTELTIEDYY